MFVQGSSFVYKLKVMNLGFFNQSAYPNINKYTNHMFSVSNYRLVTTSNVFLQSSCLDQWGLTHFFPSSLRYFSAEMKYERFYFVLRTYLANVSTKGFSYGQGDDRVTIRCVYSYEKLGFIATKKEQPSEVVKKENLSSFQFLFLDNFTW